MHGRGNWDAIGALVRSRSPLQIQAHAEQHFAQVESIHLDEQVPTIYATAFVPLEWCDLVVVDEIHVLPVCASPEKLQL